MAPPTPSAGATIFVHVDRSGVAARVRLYHPVRNTFVAETAERRFAPLRSTPAGSM